ncbi:putative frv operon regulatory protein [Escherichia coli]|uniref:putative frv operon regulatory protein n=1 Tax=Escherichia coli TaxID=562 RepID=UPI0010740FCA|nr:putative frv operon regulatory protein [Escherichia coli]EFO4256100.1 HTH domain-containing protein [Escherichia coli]TFQ97438.1 HTH domain-containing protein [Escherichia coli]HAI4892204.1 PTS transporter subunit EIIA [Escherichia coli]HAI4921644.1 PTS transporter subunit EIIA [Escherichia coli]HAI6518195.1 PTS transporter subunit EIIA [Escherichia coli]
MLNERQLKIVDLLEQQPRTPGELAQQTGVSGRTILRDIDYLNFTLNGKARITTSGSAGYQLEIFERRSFFQLLQKHDNDDRLLALLLLNTFTPRAQLASALNLPETWVAERLPRLKQRYERGFCLASRPGLGHFIDETEEKRIILLANLLRKDPFLIPLSGVTRDNFQQLTTACEKQRRWPLMQSDYLSSLILAIYALRNQLTDTWPEYPGSEIKQIVEYSGLFLGDNAVRTLTGLIEKQHQQAQVICVDNVLALLQRVPGIASLNIIDTQLVENITGHLLRCLAAPVWIGEHRQSSMNNLKATWPAAFDMSLHFITLLREQLDIPLFDSDLIGLYFACALERHQNERQPIILLSDQNAIATINQLAIERDVLNCRVIILVAIREEIEPLLIINNSHYLLDDAVNNCIIVKNIITAAGIEQIKHFLATAFIRQQPERFFSAPGSFHYSNVRGESWQHITRQICAQLVAQHHITVDEAQRIIAREGEGENLIVNRLAIPHCWSEQERRFRGFFITLAQSVEVNNEVINHGLIACAAADARHELKIFSYLASVLCQHPAEVIAGLTGYEAFMELLHKG